MIDAMIVDGTSASAPPLTDEDRWRMVLARDVASDGAFVYGVRSTGVYCRPTCPSRRPRRENVAFFQTPAEAERAGYRACRRCGSNEADDAAALAREACRLIEAAVDRAPSLATLGADLGVDPHHLQRTFKRVLGLSPREYAEAIRFSRFKGQLRDQSSVATAIYEAGFGSTRQAYEAANNNLGMTPVAYRRGGAGMRIAYTIVDCSLGRLLVGATERGICAVSFGDADAPLERALAEEYPSAEIERNGADFDAWVRQILAHLDGLTPNLDLPLDVQATAFQRRVWDALRDIPFGRTKTYRDIAIELGKPTAARAVGRACATNPVSLLIPCHRAVRSTGDLAGYRWGIERKRALLDRERVAATAARD